MTWKSKWSCGTKELPKYNQYSVGNHTYHFRQYTPKRIGDGIHNARVSMADHIPIVRLSCARQCADEMDFPGAPFKNPYPGGWHPRLFILNLIRGSVVRFRSPNSAGGGGFRETTFRG